MPRAHGDRLTFDVTVQLLVAVQIVKAHQKFTDDDSNIIFTDQPWLHEISTAAARAKLHDDPQLGALGKRAIVLCDIWRLELREDGDLLDDILDLVLGALNVNDLDGDSFASALVDATSAQRVSNEDRGGESATGAWRWELTPCRPCRSYRRLEDRYYM